MTVQVIHSALERIQMTDRSSPLAVFGTKRNDRVDAMFANTVLTQRRIEQGDQNYLGTFHRDNFADARLALYDYAHETRRVA